MLSAREFRSPLGARLGAASDVRWLTPSVVGFDVRSPSWAWEVPRVPLDFELRPSDSPLVESVWRSTSADIDEFISIASCHWNLVVCEQAGSIHVSVQGPETRGLPAPVPQDATFTGIRFQVGTTLAGLPVDRLVDAHLDLPGSTGRSFQWKGTVWRLPTYDNAEALVARLAREDLLAQDPLVDELLRGGHTDLSARTVQRRFIAATGLSHGAIRQIERARQAAIRLRQGVPAADAAYELGYYDQPHLTRSLRRLIGRTPAMLGARRHEQLSLLYKTDPDTSPTLTFESLPERERQRYEQRHEKKSRSGHDDHIERQAG